MSTEHLRTGNPEEINETFQARNKGTSEKAPRKAQRKQEKETKEPAGHRSMSPVKQSNVLDDELKKLKQKVGIGFEVKVNWLPGAIRCDEGKQLAEEVVGNTILIYTEDPVKAIELVRHGFVEWILNQHTRPYRQLVNKLITLFEEQQYEKKEKIMAALEKLLRH